MPPHRTTIYNIRREGASTKRKCIGTEFSIEMLWKQEFQIGIERRNFLPGSQYFIRFNPRYNSPSIFRFAFVIRIES